MPTESMYLVTNSQLTNIASAIRLKNGESGFYTVDEMPSKISSIGGSLNIPTFTENASTGSITCDKTYAECLELLSDAEDGRALYYAVSGSTVVQSNVLRGILFQDPDTNETICRYYAVDDNGEVSVRYEYYPDGYIYITDISSRRCQVYSYYDTVSTTSYTATDVSLTVEKSGYYSISWMGFRNTTSGTSGSQLYINGSAVGSAYTTFVNSYGQYVSFNLDLNQGDVLTVYARARSTSYIMGVGNLIIQEMGTPM